MGPILSSQTDPPTLENVDFTLEILTFLKNQRFRPQDGFESVFGLSWVRFGSFWGYFGSCLGLLFDKKNVEIRLGIHLGSFARFLLLTMASGASICFLSLLGTSWG